MLRFFEVKMQCYISIDFPHLVMPRVTIWGNVYYYFLFVRVINSKKNMNHDDYDGKFYMHQTDRN